MSLEYKIPTVADLTEIPLDEFITLAENYCGYEGTTRELIFNGVHPLFLKAHAESSKEDNPKWNQAMNSPFSDAYWKAACNDLETIEGMRAWDVVDAEDDMNVIRSTWDFKLKRYHYGLTKN